MHAGPVSAQEKKWRAESDARTLIEAQEIKLDKARHRAAVKCLREQAAAAQKAVEAAGGKV